MYIGYNQIRETLIVYILQNIVLKFVINGKQTNKQTNKERDFII